MAKHTNHRVDIGILEKQNSWLLHPRFFPSKVGGKPAWLDLDNLPSLAQLTCKKCNEALIFLCQIYAPYEESEDCFHRTVYVFICKNEACCQSNSSENLLVFRCQLPRDNKFYSSEPSEENENEIFPMDKWHKLCNICGIKAPSHCAKCKKTFYCNRKHQIVDWQKGHKEICSKLQDSINDNLNNFIVTEAGKKLLFDEWELVVNEEDEEDVQSDTDENKEMEKLRKLMQEKKAGTLNDVSDNELEQYARTIPEDKVFYKFNKRVARHPKQVLRYDRGGQPLWITSNIANSDINVPKCQYCNGDRQFEMQIMPQLLNFIDVGLEINSIDWGVLAIYTCKESCNKGPAYKEEYIIKQDITN